MGMGQSRFKAAAVLFAAAIFCYFCAESVLRQSALSRLTSSGGIGVEKIVSRLPQSFRQRVRDRIEYGRLRDALANARTDHEQVAAMVSLAMAEKKPAVADAWHRKILREHPDVLEAAPSHLHFLLRDGDDKVTIEGYHAFLRRQPQTARLALWQSGNGTLIQRQAAAPDQLAFLQPLLAVTPDCLEYGALYRRLAEVAAGMGELALRDEAEALAERCLELPTAAEVQAEIERQGMAGANAGGAP